MLRNGSLQYKVILPLVLVLICAVGCSRSLKKEDELSEEMFYFNRGMEMMEKEDYTKAVEDFQIVVDSFSGTSIVDHAQFMLAEAHYNSEEYISAAYEYERVVEDYPSSKFAPEAHYKQALCYFNESPDARLDQENTLKAIHELNRFIDTYPGHELVDEAQSRIEELTAKLAYKDYLSADLYRKLDHFDAALIYYRFVISEYPRTVWANYARFGIGEVHFEKKEYEMAKGFFQLIVNADVDNDLKGKAVKRLDEIGRKEQR